MTWIQLPSATLKGVYEEYFIRGSEAKCLPWSVIEPLHCLLDIFSGNTCQLCVFGKVLMDQLVRALVRGVGA